MRIHLMAAAMAGRRNKVALSPGPKELIFGDSVNGYFGTLTEAELISAVGLSDMVGMSNVGTFQGTGLTWLKFAVDSRIVYVASKTIRYGLAYDQLTALDLVSLTKEVFVDTNKFKLGVLTGAGNAEGTVVGGEWEATITKVLTGGPWATFAPSALGFSGTGLYSYCRDVLSNSANALTRGGTTGLAIVGVAKTNGHSNHGWRPMLEWISPDEFTYEPDYSGYESPDLGTFSSFSGSVEDQFYLPKDVDYTADMSFAVQDLSGSIGDQFYLNKDVDYIADQQLPVYNLGFSFQ